MSLNLHRNHAHTIKKKGAYLRRGRNSTVPTSHEVRFMYLVETRKPDPDTPAGFFWDLHHFPHEWSQPTPENKTYARPQPEPNKE